MTPTRRQFIGGSLAALCASQLSARAATGSAATKRFLFVHAEGGWDPLIAFAPKFGVSGIDMGAGDAPLTTGGFSLVDGPGRPSVRQFFERHGASTLLLNGLGVRSVNHETCAAVALTGFTSDDGPDWATLIANESRDDYILPHVVFSGPSFTGDYGVIVSRAAGLMDPLMKGDLLGALQHDDGAINPVSSFLAERALRLEQLNPDSVHVRDAVQATDRASQLITSRDDIDLAYRYSLRDSGEIAVRALADGLCKVASVSTGFVFDTHDDNTPQQALFDGLFSDLSFLVDLLATVNGPTGAPLSDDTVVVVVSEMGRTPAYNLTNGRDHWPFTSALLIGSGVTGNRQVGSYNDGYVGVGIDPATGEPDASRVGINASDLGATLLQLAGADPAALLPSSTPLTGLLT